MNEAVDTNDGEIFASLSRKLIDGNLDKHEQDLLFETLGKYKKQDLQKDLRRFFNKHEASVILNFHENVKTFSNLIAGYELSKEKNNQVLRQFFFKGKKVSDGFFSQTYRHVLNYIQTTATLKVKTEIFFDIHSYFKYGCFEEDLANDEDLQAVFKHVTEFKDDNNRKLNLLNSLNYDDFEKSYALKELSEKILELSEKRNLGVKVIVNRNNDFLAVALTENYLNKSNIAKSGFIDRVKQTPQGIVVSLGTADSTFEFQSEREQLARHIAALEASLMRKEFLNFGVQDIHSIDFYGLTQFTQKNGEQLQNNLVNLGIESEAMSFMSKSFGYVLGTPKISPLLKSKISFNGILCSDLNNKSLFNAENTLNVFLDNIIKNKDSIVEYFKNNAGLNYFSDYLNDLARFISMDSNKFEIKNHKTLIGKLDKVEALAKKLNISPLELESAKINLTPEFQTRKYQSFKTSLENEHQKHVANQKYLKNEIHRQKNEIKKILVSTFNIDPQNLEDKAKYNFMTARSTSPRSPYKQDRDQLGFKLKGAKFNADPNSFINFTPAQRLYLHVDSELEKRLETIYDYDSQKWKQSLYNEKTPANLKKMIEAIDQLDGNNPNSMFTLNKVWKASDFNETAVKKKKIKGLKI
jgi:uncharacterized protein (UPF0303 family)